ncbi:CPBP family intramembrane glutamic endopeptidase [Nocardia crassostreae]|uniref:CPBP family intramembrane glutamic endopeptidase n=1 Tax=Nocardia crassostreae TaxID=53428 RepID=UPI0008316577|nr:type II CAAX endopeptidase family protein [Nocardia crassostreae]
MVDERVGQRRSVIANPSGVAVFLLIAFGVPWLWLLGAVVLLGFSVVNPIVQLPMGVAPAVAAFVVRRWVTREGFADAGLAPRFRTARRWYVIAWIGPLGLAVASIVAAVAIRLWWPETGWLDPDFDIPITALTPILMIAVIVLTPVYFGEEFGWTGYLRPRMFPGRPLASVTATGLVWASCHYPLAFVGYVHFGNVFAGLAVWTASFLFQEIILTWLYVRSRSIWVPSLAHAGNNLVLSLLVGDLLAAPLGNTMVTVLLAVPLGVTAGWIVLSGRLRNAMTQLDSMSARGSRRNVRSGVGN